ncbi:FAD binding domain-containing protein [Paenibacillus sp. WLX2291]|uniref:FAD binding domain-containing protein n=1 Tax=Paenibacillus sp. WLX2291 TaxID=3296934 RepID=UPI00398448DA
MSIQQSEETVEQGPIVWEPEDAEEAVRLKRQYGAEAAFVAGGTLLRTQWENGVAAFPQHMIRLDTIPGITNIQEHADSLLIGALSSLKQVGIDKQVEQYAAVLYSACKHIAAPSIRHLATIGGNITSAVGDALPALLVHHARLVWADSDRTDSIYEQPVVDWMDQLRQGQKNIQAVLLGIHFPKEPVDAVAHIAMDPTSASHDLEGLATANTQSDQVQSNYDKQHHADNDTILRLKRDDRHIVANDMHTLSNERHMLSSGGMQDSASVQLWSDQHGETWRELGFFRKLGRREAFTPSLVTVAFRAWIAEDGRLLHVRIAAGGGSGLGMRLYNCEQWLEGQIYDPSITTQLAELVTAEFISYSDPFATDTYRQRSAGNLLAAGLWESIQAMGKRG